MDDRSSSRPRALERFGVPLLLVVASLVVYERTLAYPFVLDDRMAIVDNGFLKSARQPFVFLISDYSRGTSFGPGYFRPLMMASLWLQGSLFGWTPGPFHAVNLLLHGLAGWALFLAARALGASAAGSFFGGLLFVVFPPAQESVGSVVGRCDVLAALFLLLGWRAQIAWERGPSSNGPPRRASRAAVTVVLLGFAAMLGKESGAVFPALVALTPLALPAFRWRDRLPGRIAIGAAAAMALVAYLALRFWAVGGLSLAPEALAHSQNPVTRLPQPQRTYAALYGTGRLLLALLTPARLRATLDLGAPGPFPLGGPLDPNVALPAAALALLAVAPLALIRRRSPLALPAALLVLGLLPGTNLVVTASVFVGERFLYLPFAGVALAAAIGWDAASARWRGSAPALAAVRLCAAGLAALCAVLAATRVQEWKSEEAIARRWVDAFPASTIGWNHLGTAALERGDLTEAGRSFEASLAIDPDNAVVLSHLGDVLIRLRQWSEAERRLERAVALDPGDLAARVNLGRACLQTGERERALNEARSAYALGPGNLAARHLLGSALFENRLFGEAAREFRSLVQEDPASPQLRHSLVLSLYRDDRLDEAARAADEAALRLPGEPLFALWRARLAARRGRTAEAIDRLAEARRNHAPVADWLRDVDDLNPLRYDPRVRALLGSP